MNTTPFAFNFLQLNANPCAPPGRLGVVMLSAPAETDRENARDAEPPPESATRTVKLDVPRVLGVPLITPAVDSDRPAGKVPLVTDHAYGVTPPDAIRVVEYGTNLVAGGRVVVVNVTVLLTTI